MDDQQFKKYILNQLEKIRDALLYSEPENLPAVCYNLGALMATIDMNIEDED